MPFLKTLDYHTLKNTNRKVMTKWCDSGFSAIPLYIFYKSDTNQKVVMGLMAKKEIKMILITWQNLQMTEYFLIPMLKTK